MVAKLVLNSTLKKRQFIYSFIYLPLPYLHQVLRENSEEPSNDFSRFFTVSLKFKIKIINIISIYSLLWHLYLLLTESNDTQRYLQCSGFHF